MTPPCRFEIIAIIQVGLLYLPDISPSSGTYRATFPPRGRLLQAKNSPGVFNTLGENFFKLLSGFFQKPSQQLIQHTENLAQVQRANRRRDGNDRQHPMLDVEHKPNFTQHQDKVQKQPRGMEIHIQQAARGVGTQDKHQHQADKAGGGHAPGSEPLDKQVVQNQVDHRAAQHRDQRAGAALVHHIDAV